MPVQELQRNIGKSGLEGRVPEGFSPHNPIKHGIDPFEALMTASFGRTTVFDRAASTPAKDEMPKISKDVKVRLPLVRIATVVVAATSGGFFNSMGDQLRDVGEVIDGDIDKALGKGRGNQSSGDDHSRDNGSGTNRDSKNRKKEVAGGIFGLLFSSGDKGGRSASEPRRGGGQVTAVEIKGQPGHFNVRTTKRNGEEIGFKQVTAGDPSAAIKKGGGRGWF